MTPTFNTTQEQINYYGALLIKQYSTQPKAVATIQALATMGLLTQASLSDPILPLAVQNAFNLLTAIGEQLQFIGEAVGVKNTGYNLSGQFVTLSDADYGLLLQAASARNFLRATTPAIVSFITTFFSGIMTVRDDLRMHMTFFYAAQKGTKNWVELFITQGFLPRPLGVGYSLIYTFPYVGKNFFGVRTTISPAPSYVSQVSTVTVPLTGIVLTTSDLIPVGA